MIALNEPEVQILGFKVNDNRDGNRDECSIHIQREMDTRSEFICQPLRSGRVPAAVPLPKP